MKVVHLTSVHHRYDARICLKECLSLSKNYKVYLIVADGKGDELKEGLTILDAGEFKGRKQRVLGASKAILEKAISLKANVYHLHDPELIFIGLRLQKLGKKVIFDAHEDFPKQILTKPYIPLLLRKFISFFASIFEKRLCSGFNGIVAATPFIAEKFTKINKNVVNINNFPKIEELQIVNNHNREIGQICYIGGISVERGIVEIINALLLTKKKTSLVLAGKFHSQQLELDVKNMKGWDKVNFVGFVDREGIRNILSNVQIGLVTLHPTISYLDSLPVKLFEYMCAGIPVIASDFPLWKEIIIKYNCGICVDPEDSNEIAQAIDYLMDNPQIANEMGKNGLRAVQTEFNWANEEKKLFDFYEKVLG